jgi:hypothetical protein
VHVATDPTAADPGGVAPLVVEAFGVRVGVLPPDPSSRQRWVRQWSRALSGGPAPADVPVDVTVDARGTAADTNPDTADYTLASRVTMAALQHTKGTRMCLHAAGLSDAEGRVLALVAASGTGKTTAARTLGRSLGYLSDETVSVGDAGDVLPYAKPLSVVIDPARPYHKAQHSPDDLGLGVAPERTRLHRLVVLRRDADDRACGLEPLTVSEALTLVIPQTSYVTSFDAPLLRLTRLLQATGGPWLLRYAEIADHVDELRALLASPRPEQAPAAHHPGRSEEPAGPPGHLAREPWQDAVELEEALVVLLRSTSYRLDHLAATVWLALDRPRPLQDLVAAAEERHGSHPAAERLVTDAVGVLEQAGIVRRVR